MSFIVVKSNKTTNLLNIYVNLSDIDFLFLQFEKQKNEIEINKTNKIIYLLLFFEVLKKHEIK